MKRILVIFVALVLLVPVWSCGEDLILSEMTTEGLTALQSRIRSSFIHAGTITMITVPSLRKYMTFTDSTIRSLYFRK